MELAIEFSPEEMTEFMLYDQCFTLGTLVNAISDENSTSSECLQSTELLDLDSIGDKTYEYEIITDASPNLNVIVQPVNKGSFYFDKCVYLTETSGSCFLTPPPSMSPSSMIDTSEIIVCGSDIEYENKISKSELIEVIEGVNEVV